MLFAHDGDAEKALKQSIAASIKERMDTMCETWDPKAVMATAWGVKENVELAHAESVQSYVRGLTDSIIELEDGAKVTFLKGDVKIKPDQAILIYRYVIK